MRRVLVRGVGDIASAVAHRLFRVGYPVVLHDGPQPTTTRRKMSFADAVFDGRVVLDGVAAVRVDEVAQLPTVLAVGTAIVVVVTDLSAILVTLRPDVLVDARMRKRAAPEDQRGLSPLTIGLGPGFVAGGNADLAIETSWDDLGTIVEEGPTLPFAGEPRPIAGVARERYVYAPLAGIFNTERNVGELVRSGDVVARIGQRQLTAPIAGIVRGLTRDGVPVGAGEKVIEVDPRGETAVVIGIGERPARIAEGVSRALARWEAEFS